MLHQVLKPTLILISITLVVWILLRIILRTKNMSHSVSYKHELVLLLLVVYVTFVLSLTLFPIPMTEIDNPDAMDINLIPVINTVKQGLWIFSSHSPFKRLHVVENIVGNVLLFLPLGILLPLASAKFNSVKKVSIVAFIFSLSIELAQLISRAFGNYRTVDVDDIILNVTGAALGFFLIKWVYRKTIPAKN